MFQSTEYQRFDAAFHAFVAMPLAVVTFGLWRGGRFVARKVAELITRLRSSQRTTAG